MAQHAIVVFPETDALAAIEAIRHRFDPLAGLLRAHITLVFPFDDASAMTTLRHHVEQTLTSIVPFDLELGGISEEHGEYLFLNITAGANRLVALHHNLYTGPLAPHLSREHTYRPHITIGRLGDPGRLTLAATEARATLPSRRQAHVREVAVFRLDGPNTGQVEFTIPLPASVRT